jgi:predicted metal-dependent hydrolase
MLCDHSSIQSVPEEARMAGLNEQWKALQKQLARLEVQTRKVRGEARKRLRRVERQTRIAVRKAMRQAEPRVKQAVDEAARIGRGLRAGVRAGTATYRAGDRRKK